MEPTKPQTRLMTVQQAADELAVSPRAHLIMHAIAERITWRTEYDRAMSAAIGSPPGTANVSAIPEAA